MHTKKIINTPLLYLVLALIVGLVTGSLITRWHYKHHYKNYVDCGGSINYYDGTGKTVLYSDKTCTN